MDELKALNWIALGITLAIALAGMFAHYVKKWLRDETQDSVYAYFFDRDSIKHTLSAAGAVVVAVLSLFTAGQVDLGSLAGLTAIFTIGYAGDSALNKDSLLALKGRN